MPRVGMNPSRHQVTDYHPARVTIAMLTHIPNFTGYFSHRFDVLRLSLESLIANTHLPYDLLVFDNGSCPEVVNYLQELNDAGKIHYLLLSSRNIGKIGAFQIMFNAAPGEIVAYSDDDILFCPGWLEAHLEIIDTYPRVGMVTGIYLRTQVVEGLTSVNAFLSQPGVEVVRGRLIPEEWEHDYVVDSGREWDQYIAETANLEDIQIKYKGVTCLATAHHAQFVSPRQAILEALPDEWSGRLMGKMREVDLAVDRLGYLRLSTNQRVTQLMGNLIGDPIASKARSMGLGSFSVARVNFQSSLVQRIYRNPLIHRLAQGLYNRLYWIINA
jgi:glycosyltransferase involved in cell wall biosynthesis